MDENNLDFDFDMWKIASKCDLSSIVNAAYLLNHTDNFMRTNACHFFTTESKNLASVCKVLCPWNLTSKHNRCGKRIQNFAMEAKKNLVWFDFASFSGLYLNNLSFDSIWFDDINVKNYFKIFHFKENMSYKFQIYTFKLY